MAYASLCVAVEIDEQWLLMHLFAWYLMVFLGWGWGGCDY